MVFIKAESRIQKDKEKQMSGIRSQNLEEKKICESGSQPYHSGF
jgi:hypothetical protein